MSTGGISAYGTLFQVDNGSGTYVTVTAVTAITFAGFKLASKKVTSHSSPSATDETVPTIIDPTTINVDFNYQPTDVTQNFTNSRALGTLLLARTIFNVRVVLKDGSTGTTWQFPVFVESYKVDNLTPADTNMGHVTLHITGAATTLV